MTGYSTTECPNCHKVLILRNIEIHEPKSAFHKSRGGVLKTRLVYFDEQGRVLVKCRECGEIVPIPYRLSEGSLDL